jgi:hypothetical protein
MSKYNIVEVWNAYFGHRDTVVDYAGRTIKKSACGNPRSSYHPTIDHIRPLSKGGCDVPENIIICHRDTNKEKADKFPHWETNGYHFKAIRQRGCRTGYDIFED